MYVGMAGVYIFKYLWMHTPFNMARVLIGKTSKHRYLAQVCWNLVCHIVSTCIDTRISHLL